MKKLARISLANRSFIALVCVVMSILGVVTVTSLRQELIPSVELPAVQVVATNIGTSPDQMSAQIADPIERQVRTIDGVEETRATSRSSYTTVTIKLRYGSDITRATSQVDVAISQISSQFPDGTTTRVISGGTGNLPAAIIAVSSDLDTGELARRLKSSVIPDLQKVDGVATVTLLGAPDDVLRITFDEKAMAQASVTQADVTKALTESGAVLPGGTVVDGTRSEDITVGQPYSDIDDIRSVQVIPSKQNAAPVPLSKIATVELASARSTSVSRTNGRPSVTLVVTPTTTGNLVDISKGLDSALGDAGSSVGGKTTFTTVFDQAPYIQESIKGLGREGVLGLGFAILVILVFLLAVRPTLITAISIPLSVLFAFVGMWATDTTLNMLSLAGITITIGRMVDDSIVVTENIVRHLSHSRQPKGRAILDAVGEVAGAVTSSTLVAALVFAPLLFVTGIAGEMFRPFALTVVLSLAASLLVALTIIPVLAYWFLAPPSAAKGRKARKAAGRDDSQADPDADIEDADGSLVAEHTWLQRLYDPTVRWALRHRAITLILAGLLLVGSVAMVPLLRINLLGNSGQNFISLTETLPAGTSLAESTDRAEVTERALGKVDGVETVQTSIGGTSMSAFDPSGGASNVVTYSLTTDASGDQEAIKDRITRATKAIHGGGDFEINDNGSSAFGSSTIDVTVTAPDEKGLEKANDLLLDRIGKVKGVAKVVSDHTAAQPVVQVTVDRQKAAAMRLTEKEVVQMVAGRTMNRSVATVRLGGRDLDVEVASTSPVRTLADLKALTLNGMPLTDIATVKVVKVAPSVTTVDAVRTVTISATPSNPDELGNVSRSVSSAVDSLHLPDGARTSMGGATADIATSFSQLGVAILAAVLLIYVVLVWIFKSLVQPLVLLVSIPFAAVGSIIALVVTGTPLGLPSLIGLLMLVGIVVTNAIVLIDLVNQYRRDGMGLDEAITRGGNHRVRPIVMTAVATMMALLPSALGLSSQSSFISGPLAIVVIGGLFASTLLTLVIVPVLYQISQVRSERKGVVPGRADDLDADDTADAPSPRGRRFA